MSFLVVVIAAWLLAWTALPANAQDLGDRVELGPPSAHHLSLQGIATKDAWASLAPSGDLLYESGPSQELPPFDALLLQGQLPDPRLRLEAALDSGPVLDWRALDVHRAPDGRFWGRLDLSSRARGRIRLRAIGLGTAAFSPGQIYSIETFLRGSEDNASLQGPALPGQRQPPPALPIIPRAVWGARPPRSPFRPDEPLRITLHHTSGPQPFGAREAAVEMRFLQDFHQNGRGWDDIAYHFVIDGAGRIYQGRPESVMGAHTKDNNAGNIGICLMGDFQPPSRQRPTAAQLRSVVLLGRYLRRAYGIPAETLRGHRDYVDTTCPGRRLYSLLPSLRALIAAGDPPRPLRPPSGGLPLRVLQLFRPRFDR